MKKWILPLLFFVSSLLAETKEITPYLTSEHDTLTIIGGVVNVANGQLVEVERDLVIDGAHPLVFTRYYDGGHHFYSDLGYGVGSSVPRLLAEISDMFHWQVVFEERAGAEINCQMESKPKDKKWRASGHVAESFYKNGYTNCCEALLRGEPDVGAITVKCHRHSRKDSRDYIKVYLGNGTKRYYERYMQDGQSKENYRIYLEKCPNGTLRHFSYISPKSERLARIWTTNQDKTLTLNSLNFTYSYPTLKIQASDGQSVTYHLKNKKGKSGPWNHSTQIEADVLEKVESLSRPSSSYKQRKNVFFEESTLQRKEMKIPDRRSFTFSYDSLDRVTAILSLGSKKPLYSITYGNLERVVEDANGGKTQFFLYEKRRLKKIKEEGRSHHFTWSPKGRLECYKLLDHAKKPVITRKYSYDSQGNIKEVAVAGTITQEGVQNDYKVSYSYSTDGFNNLLEEKHSTGHSYLYTYHPSSSLVASKRVFFLGECLEREFFFYDKNAILIKKISDDGTAVEPEEMKGVTCRLETEIKPQLDPAKPGLTLPWRIEEYSVDLVSGMRQLLKIRERTYTQGSLLAEEKTYDSLGNYRYSEKKEYNAHRQQVSETNGEGETTLYQYNDQFQLKREEKVESGKWRCYFYDSDNFLIEEVEKDSLGRSFSTKHSYDLLGRRTLTTDRCSQVTRFEYDKLGREIAVTDPNGHREQKGYDCNDHINLKIDPAGFTTRIVNNIYGKPLKITHPDGSQERFEYNLSGHLIKKVERDGTLLCYAVDYAGRVTAKSTYSPSGELLKKEEKCYKGGRLLSEIDAMGNKTLYDYDSAGRLIKKAESGRATYYAYDLLGRLYKTTLGKSVEIKCFDNLNRIVEERTEDLEGKVYQKREVVYDSNGNVIQEKLFIDDDTQAITKTTYNSDNLPTLIIDPEGHTTTIDYHYSDHFEKVTIDSQGRKCLESYDPCQRLAHLKKFDSSETLLSCTTFQYDQRGLEIRRSDDRLMGGKSLGYYTVETNYDCMGQKSSEVEQATKRTEYTYEYGKLKTLTFPSGTVLTHSYDALGRLATLYSSDETIHSRYRYDKNNNLLTAEDLLDQTIVSRRYNALNQLVEERQSSGLCCSYSYDPQSRLIQFSMPDGTLTYTYSPRGLIEVARSGSQNYHYRQTIDWRGKPTSCTLPNGSHLRYFWTLNGRLQEIATPHYHQVNSYDSAGNLIVTEVKDPLGAFTTRYSYDGLNQLSSEEGLHTHTYLYDALHNRHEKNSSPHNIDSLNRTLHDGESCYSYDKEGRRIQKDGAHYCYDALGRLVQYENNNQLICYHYDALGRRMKKSVGEATYYYLYQLDTEVGLYFNGILNEFKACYDKRSPFALELEGECYSTIRTARGDICQLQDALQTPVATYRYDAFGLFSHQGSVASPWLFSGQRYDQETTLYTFLKRDYDPALGRWLTPDPLGFADGPNLYAYVHNNPLTHTDLYGLLDTQDQRVRNQQNTFSQNRGFKSFIRPDAFKRGVLDDTTFGASELALGEFKCKDWVDKANYHTGTFASLAAGLTYGATEFKFGLFIGKLTRRILVRTAIILGLVDEGSKAASHYGLFKKSEDVYAPDRDLPRDKNGLPVPDTDAAHTQLGKKDGRNGKYPQAREFDENGRPLKDIDFTDHGRPYEHSSPHQHPYIENETGGTLKRDDEQPLSNWSY